MREDRLIDAIGRPVSRREMLRRSALGFAGLGVGGVLLSACGSNSATTSSGTGSSAAAGSGGTLSLTEYNSLGGDTFANAMTYIAQDQGMFAEEGIDYKIEYIEGTVRAVQSIVGGDSGVAWADAFGQLSAVAAGFPLKSLFMTFQGPGFGEFVTDESPITTLDSGQAKGAKFGITDPTGGEVPGLRGALARLGLKEDSDYQLEVIGTGTPEIAEALETGRIDVMAMSVLDAVGLEYFGLPTRNVTPQYVQNFPGHSYFTTPDQAEQNTDVLERFLRVRAKALVWLRTNPIGAAAIGIKYAPASAEGVSPKQAAGFLETTWVGPNEKYFADPGSKDYHQIGLQSTDLWDQYQKFLIDANVESESGKPLKEPLDVGEIVDNGLIGFANEFDYAEIEKASKAYGTEYDPKKKVS